MVTNPGRSFLNTTKLLSLATSSPKSSSGTAVQQFACIPTLLCRDLLAFVDPYNEKNRKKVFIDLFAKYGQIFKLRVPGSRYHQVYISDPEDARTLLMNDGPMPITAGFDFFVAYRSKVRRDLYEKTGGLFGAHGHKWHEVRSLVQQDMMRPKSAMFYIDSIEEISEQLADVFTRVKDANDEIDDITDYMSRWSLEAITSIFLNSRLGCLNEIPSEDGQTLIRCSQVVLGSDMYKLATRPPIWKYLPVPYYTRFDRACTEMLRICRKYVDATTEGVQKNQNKTENKSVLEKLINRSKDNADIPAIMAVDAMMAGIETTGAAATFLLYHLAANQDQQLKLFEEIQSVLGDDKITEAKLKKMKYLKACCQESHRLLPVVAGISRRTQAEIVLSGYQIPTKTTVAYISLISMAIEEHFEYPSQFIPERWLRGNPDHHHAHAFAHVPFGHGPRMCVGRRFAEVELYLLVIKMMQRFRMEYGHRPVGLTVYFTNKPDKEVKIKFIER